MNDELRSEVLRRKYGGQSGRDIARDLHLSRKTVAKVLAEHRQQRANGTTGLPEPRKSRGSMVDPHDATLRDYLARYSVAGRGGAKAAASPRLSTSFTAGYMGASRQRSRRWGAVIFIFISSPIRPARR